MNITDTIKQLELIWDGNDCKCIDEPPYIECKRCTAAHALNEIGETARDALRDTNAIK